MKIKLNVSKFKILVNSKHIIDLKSPLNVLKTECTISCKLRVKPLDQENPYKKVDVIVTGENIEEEIKKNKVNNNSQIVTTKEINNKIKIYLKISLNFQKEDILSILNMTLK